MFPSLLFSQIFTLLDHSPQNTCLLLFQHLKTNKHFIMFLPVLVAILRLCFSWQLLALILVFKSLSLFEPTPIRYLFPSTKSNLMMVNNDFHVTKSSDELSALIPLGISATFEPNVPHILLDTFSSFSFQVIVLPYFSPSLFSHWLFFPFIS